MHDLERMRTDYAKLTAKSPWMRIDFAYNFSSVTYPALPLWVSRSQHSRPFEIFSFSSVHSNILSPLVQRSFYPWSLQRASCWYDFAGFFKPRREPWSTLLRGRSNERRWARLHAGSLLYWKKTRAENRGWFSTKKAWKKRIVRNEFIDKL